MFSFYTHMMKSSNVLSTLSMFVLVAMLVADAEFYRKMPVGSRSVPQGSFVDSLGKRSWSPLELPVEAVPEEPAEWQNYQRLSRPIDLNGDQIMYFLENVGKYPKQEKQYR